MKEINFQVSRAAIFLLGCLQLFTTWRSVTALRLQGQLLQLGSPPPSATPTSALPKTAAADGRALTYANVKCCLINMPGTSGGKETVRCLSTQCEKYPGGRQHESLGPNTCGERRTCQDVRNEELKAIHANKLAAYNHQVKLRELRKYEAEKATYEQKQAEYNQQMQAYQAQVAAQQAAQQAAEQAAQQAAEQAAAQAAQQATAQQTGQSAGGSSSQPPPAVEVGGGVAGGPELLVASTSSERGGGQVGPPGGMAGGFGGGMGMGGGMGGGMSGMAGGMSGMGGGMGGGMGSTTGGASQTGGAPQVAAAPLVEEAKSLGWGAGMVPTRTAGENAVAEVAAAKPPEDADFVISL